LYDDILLFRTPSGKVLVIASASIRSVLKYPAVIPILTGTWRS
jgi:hypothetical protein